jgi:hypothetical protein
LDLLYFCSFCVNFSDNSVTAERFNRSRTCPNASGFPERAAGLQRPMGSAILSTEPAAIRVAEDFAQMANLILRCGPIPAFRADLAKLVSQMNFVG